jgi:hypothetical protein
MDKRLIIGSLVGAVAVYALGFLIWGMIFTDFFADNTGSATGVPREAPIIWAALLGSLLYAAMLTLALQSRGATAPLDALKIGGIVGLLLWGTADFILFANFNLNNLTATIADTVLEGVRGGVAGTIIAFVLAKVGN